MWRNPFVAKSLVMLFFYQTKEEMVHLFVKVTKFVERCEESQFYKLHK